MSQAQQFMLRLNTYGPDLLDDQGQMPKYRELVTDVITPKFETSFEKGVVAAEQTVAKAGLSRDGEGVRHRRLHHRRRLRHRPGRRLLHQLLPRRQGPGASPTSRRRSASR